MSLLSQFFSSSINVTNNTDIVPVVMGLGGVTQTPVSQIYSIPAAGPAGVGNYSGVNAGAKSVYIQPSFEYVSTAPYSQEKVDGLAPNVYQTRQIIGSDNYTAAGAARMTSGIRDDGSYGAIIFENINYYSINVEFYASEVYGLCMTRIPFGVYNYATGIRIKSSSLKSLKYALLEVTVYSAEDYGRSAPLIIDAPELTDTTQSRLLIYAKSNIESSVNQDNATFDVSKTSLSSESVDKILIDTNVANTQSPTYWNGSSYVPYTPLLKLNGGCSSPSQAGITAKNELIAKGFDVQTN